MPRIRYSLAPKGLFLNATGTTTPEGSLLQARNVASLAGGGYVRSSPPNRTVAGTGPSKARARTKFNGRFYNRGEITSTQQIERETTLGGNAYANLTLPADARPTLTLRSSSNPMLFTTGQPTPDKDEYLFCLDPPNTAGDNALLKIKDTGTVTHWGILPPTAAEVGTPGNITATKNAQGTKYILPAGTDPMDDSSGDGVDTVDWVLSSGDEDALTADSFSRAQTAAAGHPVAPGSTKSVKFRAEKDAVAQITRTLASPVDLTTFGGTASSDADFIQFWVRVRRARHIISLEVQFDTDDGSFKTAVFSREVNFQLVRGRKRRKLKALGDLVPDRKQAEYLNNNKAKTLDLNFSEEMGKQTIPVAKNSWSRVTLPKSTFNGDGNPSWATVKAIRFILHTNKEGRGVVFLDELQLVGGAGLYGDYQYTITYSSEDGTPASAGSRSNPPIDDDKGTVSGLRNSIITVKVSGVERQSVRLTFVAGLTFDPQVTRLEIWRTVGNGAAFFRCGYIAVSGGTLAAASTFDDSAADYYGLNDNAAPVVAGNNTGFAVLDPSLELPIDNTSPNDPSFAFQTMADRPHLGRMWWGRNVAAINETGTAQASLGNHGQVYYSPVGRLEAVQGSVFVTTGVTDPVQAMVVWNDRLFVFTSSSLFEIVGTDEPFVAQKVEGCPGTSFPYTVQPSPVGILWIGPDGVYKFNGQFAENITDPCLMPVFRHRLAVQDLTVTTNAACRAVVGRNTYYIGPDFTNFTMCYDFESGTWRYIDSAGNVGTNSGALYYDPALQMVFCDSTAGGADLTEMEPQSYGTVNNVSFFGVQFGPAIISGPGRQGILRRVFVDITGGPNFALTSMAPTINFDGTSLALPTFAITSSGIHTIAEYVVNKPGTVFSISLTGNSARDIRINHVELDYYVPGESDQDFGGM